jgi:hypothetical protein
MTPLPGGVAVDWVRVFRVESIEPAEPDADGWVAFDLTLRPVDKRGRVNGRTRNLTTLKVGGPPEWVDMTGLRVGVKAEFAYGAGPVPTERAMLHPAGIRR